MSTEQSNVLTVTHGRLESIAGQLRSATKLHSIGDDVTGTIRRLGHALRDASDNLREAAGDVLVHGEWCTIEECWAKVQSRNDLPVHLREQVPVDVLRRWGEVASPMRPSDCC